MGKRRLPLEMQKGNLTVLQQEKRKREQSYVITGKDQLAEPPIWLIDEIAIAEFNRIVKELKGIDIVGNLDLDNLGAYANAFSHYIHTTEELKNMPMLVDKATAYGIVKVANPLIKVQTNYASEMRRFASLCGMTIDSRLKAGGIAGEEKQKNVTRKFGDI